MAGWGTRQFSPYLRSMFRRCLLLIGVLPGAAAPAASQDAGALRDRLEARIARAPAQAVGLYYRNLARPDSLRLRSNLRLPAARPMTVAALLPTFRGPDA